MRKFFQEKLNISETTAKWGGRIFGLAVILLAYVLGFGGKPDSDPFNVGNLYEAIHPMKIHDIIGLIIFTLGVAWITGIVELFIGEISVPEGSTWPNWAGVVAMVGGLLLCWA